jgi:DNA-directed RNA polymerase specialized sigma24 family protein
MLTSTTTKMTRKKTENYVNNREFLDAMVVYRKKVKECEQQGLPKPKVPDYIGECFLKIATHLSYKPNFVNYMFREDMICDGIENCLQYIDNFNPEKSTNPFAYFTQIIYFAFLRRIQREKKQLYIKHKSYENSMLFEGSAENHELDENDFAPTMAASNDNMLDFVKTFEDNLDKKKIKRKQGLEKFFEEEQ